ncbi:hypothetical protein QYE76_015308 [Lolium multiflorum]|uniref:F-box domain-containing protein n=1 Tax=Lolium multiflorum TaxID=4521 RepID=A0AAD8X6N0_LOLMU|nr:hypothetical protein QYE76_015308 [Lolium multiflorum]
MGGSKATMAVVIGVDDLLREILLRLDFPAFLVRAALVSKRWLALAADPAFLRRFRDRHPPRLLSFYFHDACSPRPQFVLEFGGIWPLAHGPLSNSETHMAHSNNQ